MKILSLLLTLTTSLAAQASCRKVRDARLDLQIAKCRALDPRTDPTLLENAMGNFFTGVLLEDPKGKKYVYLTIKEAPCQDFPEGKKVAKMTTQSCCDTGSWGKCRFGGHYLYDLGTNPPNVFQ